MKLALLALFILACTPDHRVGDCMTTSDGLYLQLQEHPSGQYLSSGKEFMARRWIVVNKEVCR